MLKTKSGGFTLIEITIVMAITAGMAVIIISGQQTVRAQAEFTGTVNSTVSSLEAVRNSAQTSDNTGNAAAGTDLTQIVFAKLITAKPGDNFITVSDIIGTGNQMADCATLQESLSQVQDYQIPLKWGVKVAGTVTDPTVLVAFHRLLCGGRLMTYNLPAGATPPSQTTQSSYSETLPSGQSAAIKLIDPDGRTATITVDGTHNGAVSRSFQ